MRVSPSALFVVLAVVAASAIGVSARSAAGADDEASAPPADAARFGFGSAGRAGDVLVLEATRPFRLGLGNGPVRGVQPAPEPRARALAVAARELARYPRGFARVIGLRGLLLASELTEGETPIPSLPNVGGLLLLDVDAHERDLVRALHHEVFHFVDRADDGRLSPDPSWEALNAEGFNYGGGGRSVRGSWAALPSPELAGFVSGYATSGPEEDKAETFAFLVARPESIRPRLASDPVLVAKARAIRARLAALDEAAAALVAPL